MSNLEMAIGTIDSVVIVLGGVERALERLEEGRYGRCEECGAELDEAVLELAPTADHCPEHAAPPG